jgi:signal transduction histidine kinase
VKELGAKIDVGDLPPCTGDFVQVNQVFSNLVDNALKYCDPERPLVIKVTGENVGDEVVYCVGDNGAGIAVEHQRKVFEIFHRLSPGVTEGEGLGLSIVKKVIGRHNGRIWVESEPGVGSKFYVSLPDGDQ